MRARMIEALPWDFEDQLPPYEIVRTARMYRDKNELVLRRLGIADMSLMDPSSPGLSLARRGLPADLWSQVQWMYRDWVPLTVWDQYRQVYVVHPALTQELLRSKSDSFPSTVLRSTRVPNPMTVIPGGLPVRHSDGKAGRVRMFTTTGFRYTRGAGDPRANPRKIMSTEADGLDGLSVHVMSEVLSSDSKTVVDMNWCHLAIPLLDKVVSLESLLERSLAKFSAGGPEHTETEQFLRTMYAIVLPHLLYPQTSKAEVDPADDAVSGQRPGKKSRAAGVSYLPVGYRLGAAIDAHRRNRDEQRGPTGTGHSGYTLTPHLRSPHFHTYWTGPGRTEAEVKYLSLITVNADKIGPEGLDVTLRPMGSRRSGR